MEMNDKTKKLIKPILIIIIVLILFAIYLIYSIIKGNQGGRSKSGNVYTPIQDVTYHSKIEKANKVYELFHAERCIQIYFDTLGRIDRSIYYSTRDEEEINNKIIDNKQQLYSMLDEEYIYNYNLTIDNMDERFSNFYNTLQFLTENVYVLDDEDTYESVYFVYGDLVNVSKNTIQQYGFIIRRQPRKHISIHNNSL